MTVKLKETDLAAKVVSWLQEQQWDVYQEVGLRHIGKCADIVARQNNLIWVIECKTHFGLTVLAQADSWRPYAHLSSVAVMGSVSPFGDGIAKSLGVGVISVYPGIDYYIVSEHTRPAFNRKALTKKFTSILCDKHKTCAPAGSNYGGRWSPFRATCESLESFVRANPGAHMKSMLDNVKTHYSSKTTANICLAKWIDAGVVPGVRMERKGREIRLYPAE